MPNDATEGVAKHSYMLQTVINFHAPGTAFMFNCSGTDVLHRRDEGSGMPRGAGASPAPKKWGGSEPCFFAGEQ